MKYYLFISAIAYCNDGHTTPDSRCSEVRRSSRRRQNLKPSLAPSTKVIGLDDRNEVESSIAVAIRSPTGSEVSPKPDFCKPYSPADDSDSELREFRSNKPIEAIGDNDYSERKEHSGYSTSSDEMIVTDGVDHVLTSSMTTKVNSASSRDVLQYCLPAPGGNNDLKLFLMIWIARTIVFVKNDVWKKNGGRND